MIEYMYDIGLFVQNAATFLKFQVKSRPTSTMQTIKNNQPERTTKEQSVTPSSMVCLIVVKLVLLIWHNFEFNRHALSIYEGSYYKS